MALLWVTEDTSFLWWFVDILFFLTSLNILQVQLKKNWSYYLILD